MAGATVTLNDVTGLSQATLLGADLSGSDLSAEALAGVRAIDLVGCPAGLPDDWSCQANMLLGPTADLTDLDLSGLDLSTTSLVDATFKNTTALSLAACPSALPASVSCVVDGNGGHTLVCLLYTSPSPRDATLSRMPSSA